MGRTGVKENSDANKQYTAQGTKAFKTGQTAIQSGIAGEQELEAGKNIGADPFKDPGYLGNVNRLQAGSLNAAEDSSRSQLEAWNQRTGGLGGGAVPYASRDLSLQKMRLGDQLSSQRAADDYKSNLAWQQYLEQNRYAPAQAEQGYYGTATQGRAGALDNLTKFGVASYGPWMQLISNAKQAAAAGAEGG